MKKRAIQFTVRTKPISINKAYRSIIVRGRPSAILTTEGKRFKAAVKSVAWAAMKAGGFGLITGPFSMRVDYFLDPRAEGDVTNYDKALIDGMKGVVFKDDRALGRNKDPEFIAEWIFFEATFRKWFDPSDPRTEVTVTFYQ